MILVLSRRLRLSGNRIGFGIWDVRFRILGKEDSPEVGKVGKTESLVTWSLDR